MRPPLEGVLSFRKISYPWTLNCDICSIWMCKILCAILHTTWPYAAVHNLLCTLILKILKVGTDPRSVIMSKLINMSIGECTLPDLFRYAEMAALCKKLGRLCEWNYRTVSILTALSKVLRKSIVVNWHIVLIAYFLSIIQASGSDIAVWAPSSNDRKMEICIR